MSSGYELNFFASPPDCKFLCSVCYGVLKRPVSLPCSYIFCKKCTLQWLARQDICPCCRKEVKRKKMVHVNKLWKTIDHPEVMCKNAEAGCSVTCPLVHRKKHQDSSPFELMACPNEGCSAWVFHGALAEHQQHCQQAGRQHCPLGCGATLGTAELAHYHCDLKLPEAWSERQEHSQMLLQGLQGRVHRVHHAGSWPSSATSWKMMPRM